MNIVIYRLVMSLFNNLSFYMTICPLGGQYGPNVRRWMDTTREADLGQCFVAIDPSYFAPGFPDRMADLMDHCRNMESVSVGSLMLFHWSIVSLMTIFCRVLF